MVSCNDRDRERERLKERKKERKRVCVWVGVGVGVGERVRDASHWGGPRRPLPCPRPPVEHTNDTLHTLMCVYIYDT